MALNMLLCVCALSTLARGGALLPVSPKVTTAREHSSQWHVSSDLASTNGERADRDRVCPPWFLPTTTNGSRVCECGNTHDNIVTCERGVANLLSCYCMTYGSDIAVVGQCLVGCVGISTKPNSLYIRVPDTVDELEDLMCYRNNREGQLCGQCKKGYTVPIYSYSLACTACHENETNWLLYVTVAAVPLTVFLILIIVLRINASSGRFHGLITFSQIVACPPQMWAAASNLDLYPQYVQVLTHPALAFYGIWNLDFFRLLYTPFCLYTDMTTLEAMAFEYFIALYPLAFLAVIYLLVKLRETDVGFLAWIWWPLHKCTARFRRQFDITKSLVHAFTTCFFLSFTKFLAVSVELLLPTVVHSIHPNMPSRLYFYYDGSVKYFGPEHLPYAVLAIVMLSVFVVLPVLLLIAYQFSCFHRIMEVCRLRYTYSVLKVFMDACQGDYKDGTDGGRDYRFFPVVYLMLRIVLALVYSCTLSIFYYPIASIVVVAVVLFVAVAKPYRESCYNSLDIFLLTTMTGVYSLLLLLNVAELGTIETLSETVAGVLAVLPFIYSAGYLLVSLCSKLSVCVKVRKAMIHGDRCHVEELAHRINNAQEYTPLLGCVAVSSCN